MAASAPSRRDKRRQLRRAMKRRVRGGEGRAPVAVQRAARTVDDAAFRTRGRLRKAFAGDRPFLLGFVALLVLGVMVISGPLRAYLDQRDRVELLEQQLAVLEATNGDLDQRARDLQDPDHLIPEARERFGYVRPGEVPYVIVPPERDGTTISEPLDVATADDARSLPRKVWDVLTGWFG